MFITGRSFARIAAILRSKMSATLIISLEGDLDITSRESLDWKLKPAHFADPVIIDLTKVVYVDSTALSAFVRLRKARTAKGYQPALYVIPSIHVRKVFSITDLDTLWEIYDTLDEAVAALENLPGLPA
jgi:anti-anti-sigma factor